LSDAIESAPPQVVVDSPKHRSPEAECKLGDNAADEEWRHRHLGHRLAMAAYRAAIERWPNTPITLRQGARVIEDSRRLRLA
jgi:predicted GNAT family N-acyltransferase